MEPIQIIFSALGLLGIGSIITVLLTKWFSKDKDAVDLASDLQEFYEPVLAGIRSEYTILQEAFKEKDAAHAEEKRKMREEHKKEILDIKKFFTEKINKLEKIADDLLGSHKEKDVVINSQRITIGQWAENDIKKDLIIKDLKKKIPKQD